jgi:catechol 2,3-dioxygenase-like lactoylglutathione lyase family enzyme
VARDRKAASLAVGGKMARAHIENTIPVLAVSELDQSIEFFRRALGFELEWRTGPICSIGRDGSSVMLQAREQAAPSTVWIGIDDDSMLQDVERSGAKIVQAPENKPWAYEMKNADPDGNVLWLGAEPQRLTIG